MIRVILVRLALFALPFLIWFVWREAARRAGRPMGSTPWSWLVAVGACLIALSLVAGVFFSPRTRDLAYVPGSVAADGSVTPGQFVPKAAKP
jgi:drug/metabolite transporter (DMT)-like permease